MSASMGGGPQYGCEVAPSGPRQEMTAIDTLAGSVRDRTTGQSEFTGGTGNAGIGGQSFMHGSQNQFLFLHEQHSYFPFPVFAEDWGFLGCVGLVGLYTFLVLWSLRVAATAKARFGRCRGLPVLCETSSQYGMYLPSKNWATVMLSGFSTVPSFALIPAM